MRYLGGKSKLGKQIAYAINTIRRPGQPYWEPFCGSCWVTIHIRGAPRYCSDGCYELIEMWKALQSGWKPPKVVTEEMYAEAKAGKYDSALTAFIGFGCSFGGKWFAGYARDPKSDRNYAQAAASGVLKRAGQMGDVVFIFEHYGFIEPPPCSLIYCDPPYQGTERYEGVPFCFVTDCFFGTVRDWCSAGHVVIVSEYAAPDDFVCIREMQTQTDLEVAGGGKDPRIERLFMHESQAHLASVIPVQLSF